MMSCPLNDLDFGEFLNENSIKILTFFKIAELTFGNGITSSSSSIPRSLK